MRNICDSLKSILDYFLQLKDTHASLAQSTMSYTSNEEFNAISKQPAHYKMASALYDIITLKIFNSNNPQGDVSDGFTAASAIHTGDRFSTFDHRRSLSVSSDSSNNAR